MARAKSAKAKRTSAKTSGDLLGSPKEIAEKLKAAVADSKVARKAATAAGALVKQLKAALGKAKKKAAADKKSAKAAKVKAAKVKKSAKPKKRGRPAAAKPVAAKSAKKASVKRGRPKKDATAATA